MITIDYYDRLELIDIIQTNDPEEAINLIINYLNNLK